MFVLIVLLPHILYIYTLFNSIFNKLTITLNGTLWRRKYFLDQLLNINKHIIKIYLDDTNFIYPVLNVNDFFNSSIEYYFETFLKCLPACYMESLNNNKQHTCFVKFLNDKKLNKTTVLIVYIILCSFVNFVLWLFFYIICP